MKKYNHLYTLAFSVNTDRPAEWPASATELIAAVLQRIANLSEGERPGVEWNEAVGPPEDTYENEAEAKQWIELLRSDACPVCKAHDVEGGGVDIGELSATQECNCVECGASWTAIYALLEFTDIEEEQSGSPPVETAKPASR